MLFLLLGWWFLLGDAAAGGMPQRVFKGWALMARPWAYVCLGPVSVVGGMAFVIPVVARCQALAVCALSPGYWLYC